MQDKTLKYRDLRRLLSSHGVYEVKRRGKGSHRLFICDNVNGQKVSCPVACHNESHEVNSYIVRRIREKFNIAVESFYD
ncbi:MAG TPA: type II toxin-antitoxin system HicA family toxin [Candidatus Omnitrophota bacterium]|nr:type II toxin-antitoxin system HicA family toxin [Candidatus Omnitrophota bacterium]